MCGNERCCFAYFMKRINNFALEPDYLRFKLQIYKVIISFWTWKFSIYELRLSIKSGFFGSQDSGMFSYFTHLANVKVVYVRKRPGKKYCTKPDCATNAAYA